MAAGWQPSPAGLDELLSCLRQTQAPDTAVQQRVRERIEQFHAIPDFPCYLAYVLVTPNPAVPPNDRAVAGYLLQTAVRQRFDQLLAGPANVLAYLKATLLDSLHDADLDVRRAGQGVITWMIRAVGPEAWPEAIERLVQLVEGPGVDEKTRLAAFGTISRLCEDMPRPLETAMIGGQRLLDILVPKILQYVSANEAGIRQTALSCLIPFISLPALDRDGAPGEPNALVRRMHEFLPVLFSRATDPSSQVRKSVCSALVGLLAHHPQTIMPQINGVVDYILHCTQDQSDTDLALEACEFWLTFAESPELAPALRPYLDRVAPVLLNGAVYDEDELFALDGLDGAEDAAVPDRAEDIKPRHYGAKAHTAGAADKSADPEGLLGGQSAQALKSREAAEAAEDDDDGEYDEDDEDEDYSEWTLRKCSAAALDVMAVQFEADLLPILLPLLKQKLFSDDWLQRESAILALGAIAEGACDGLETELTCRLHHRHPGAPPRPDQLPHQLLQRLAGARPVDSVLGARAVRVVVRQRGDVGGSQAIVFRAGARGAAQDGPRRQQARAGGRLLGVRDARGGGRRRSRAVPSGDPQQPRARLQ